VVEVVEEFEEVEYLEEEMFEIDHELDVENVDGELEFDGVDIDEAVVKTDDGGVVVTVVVEVSSLIVVDETSMAVRISLVVTA
jgi:hypothetical protein